MIATLWPAASTVAPWLRINACVPACTCGATSTTSPLRAITVPSTCNAPPAPPNAWRPARASASVMGSVEAVKAAVSTTAPAPTAIPAGFTSTSRPLERSVPKIAEGSAPTTRLMEVLVAEGWSKRVMVPEGTEKLCQLIAE